MERIQYRHWTSSDLVSIQGLIKAFYEEAGEGDKMTDAKIQLTFNRLLAHPDNGTIEVFEVEQRIIGYSLLVNFWSNEYGGTILVIDELYIIPEFQGKGIGSRFIKYLNETRFNDCVALELEVLPYNTRALQLYEQLGFKKSDRSYLLLEK
jgi:GNAT superfamily N-acetyltransferase